MSKNDAKATPIAPPGANLPAPQKPNTLHPGLEAESAATLYGATGDTGPKLAIDEQATFIKPEVVLNAPAMDPSSALSPHMNGNGARPGTGATKVVAVPPSEPLPVGKQVTANGLSSNTSAGTTLDDMPTNYVPSTEAPAKPAPAVNGARTGTAPSPAAAGGDPEANQSTQLLTGSAAVAPAKPATGAAPAAKPSVSKLPTAAAQGASPAKPPTKTSGALKMPDLKSGQVVNHYELIRELGKGGMGSVFLARDNKLGRRVAIKFLHTSHPELTQRFILEARTTARFSHENIVIIYEVDEHAGQPYMVLEYLQGQPLTKLIADGKPMPGPRAVELMVPVVRALASAHAEKIVHRDLKFDNVFVTDSGLIKVLDFGIAKVLGGEDRTIDEAEKKKTKSEETQTTFKLPSGPDDSTDLTRHGTIMGTLAFMSPEQWGKGGPIDNRTDIWAAGIMLFRMLSGKHPLSPLTGMALAVTGKLDEPMPKLRSVNPEVPQGLADVVDRCLLKKKDERWPDANAFLRALEPFLPGRFNRDVKVDESPYAGLSSFQESDADRFFGRTNEIAALVNRVADVPLLGVVGPSGTGKSSFVRAGLVPALKRSGQNWETLVIRPGRNPLQALASIVGPLVSTSTDIAGDLAEQKKLVQRLADEPGYVGSVLRSRARRGDKNIMVFVDQFEELYTLVPDQKERLNFTACLASIADDATSPTRVVLSIRSDFLDRVAEDQRFMAELTRGLFFLAPPARDGLRDALVQPAEMHGYKFDAGVVDDMLSHLATTQGALPLLQFAASKLWESRDATRKLLTKQSYDALGGIAGALASHADAVLREMTQPARALTRAIVLRLVTPERTRAIVALEDLRELNKNATEVQRVIDQLVQARLLVVQTGGGGGGATVEIVHESLIQNWAQLRRWLDETGEDAAFLEQLRNATKQWQTKGKDSGLLWRGEVVEEAHRFERRYKGELPASQREFLDAVFGAEKRAARMKRLATVGGVGFLGLLVVASGVALIVVQGAKQEAIEQAKVARVAEQAAQKAQTDAEKERDQVKEKEKERAAAAKQADEARERAEAALDDVKKKSSELAEALKDAENANHLAAAQRAKALANAYRAVQAEQEARKHADEASRLADTEKQRVKDLEKQLGSTAIETLK